MTQERTTLIVARLVAEILIALTRLLRPLLGIAGTCRYTISCSAYTRYVLKNFPLHRAVWMSSKRIAQCAFFIKP